MRCDNGAVTMRLMAIIVGLAAAAVQAQPWTTGTITYDGAGNITAMGADVFVYDSAGRLVKGTSDQQRSSGSNRQEYSYDAFGNRLATTTFGASCVGGCAPSDLTASTSTNRISNHGAAYDSAGNLTALDGTTFSYDGAGMMAEQIGPNSSVDWRYVYTADDERIATFTGSGNWRFTVRDVDGKVMREFIASQTSGSTTWTWDQDHVYRDGLLLATVSPSGRQQFHLDHLGTPRLVTNTSGVQTGIHSYYPFGDELALTPTENPVSHLKYTAHERDETSSVRPLDYMHARFYSAVHGRFLSPDPMLGDPRRPQSWNRYTYVENNPIGHSDPSGLCIDSIVCLNWGKVEDETTVIAPHPPPQGTWSAAVEDMAIGVAQQNAEYAAIDQRAASDYAKYYSVAANAIAPDYNEMMPALALAGGLAAGATTITNPVPSTLARVIPGELTPATLGRVGASDVFVTAADDIAGMNASQLGTRLGIPSSDAYTVIEFPTPAAGIASPIARTTPGFIGGGLTSGGAREFVIPNGPIPWGGVIRVIRTEGIP